MAYTTINKSTDHFNTVTFTGNNSTQNITGVGFQPDWVWLKKRNGTANHHAVDAVRGVGYYLYPNLTNVQGGNGSSLLTAFGADGFTLDNGADSNGSGATGVSWSWKAGTGAGSSNTNGSINTASTSVNSTAKFSISKYTGTGSAGATIGHGLGVKPSMIIVKGITYAEEWEIYHKSLGATKTIKLNNNAAASTTSSRWNDAEPTSSVFTVGNADATNKSGYDYIAYCFANVDGYSKFGSYTGNGNADGAFVYTGFKPAFLITKKTSATGPWDMFDNKRNVINPVNSRLHPNASDTEYTNSAMNIDFVSNGFKLRTTDNELNTDNADYIYMAFGQSLVGTNNVPCTGR